jgi:hypothetical protein
MKTKFTSYIRNVREYVRLKELCTKISKKQVVLNATLQDNIGVPMSPPSPPHGKRERKTGKKESKKKLTNEGAPKLTAPGLPLGSMDRLQLSE